MLCPQGFVIPDDPSCIDNVWASSNCTFACRTPAIDPTGNFEIVSQRRPRIFYNNYPRRQVWLLMVDAVVEAKVRRPRVLDVSRI